jgi:hypothetical protein
MNQKKSRKSDIGTAIGNLRGSTLSLIQSRPIDVDKLLETIENTQEYFATMQAMFSITGLEVHNSSIEDCLDSMSFIVNNLYSAAQRKAPPPTAALLEQITSTLDVFLNKIITKKNRIKLRKALSYIGIAESVLYYCGNIPHFWTDADSAQKVIMVLGAVLVVSSVTLTIAAFANPAIGPIVGGGFGIMLIAALGIFMYRLVLEDIRPKHNEQNKIKKALREIEQLKVSFDEFITNQLPDYTPKDNLVYSIQNVKPVAAADETLQLQPNSKSTSPKIKPGTPNSPKEKED